MSSRLIELAENLPPCRAVLVGDFMVDRYLYGDADRLNPEAPVPILRFDHEDVRLGGAGNVAANLAALGATVAAVGVAGDDEPGRSMRALLKERNVDAAGLHDAGRPTTCKVRFVGLARQKSGQQMLRLDFEDASPVSPEVADAIVASATSALASADVLCVEDYHKGVLSGDVAPRLIAAARAAGVPSFVDPPRLTDYAKFAGATCLKLNRPEAEAATGLPARTPDQVAAAASKLLETLDLQAVVVTLDADGAYLATRGDDAEGPRRRHVAGKPRQVSDVVGAGDMVFAALAVARSAGASWVDAVALATVAGGLEVERFGAVPITPSEIVQELLGDLRETEGKQRTLDALLPEVRRHRAAGKRVVFTNGCFDIVHLGHVQYFRYAKAQGDVLIVGVNTDAGIRRLKGEKRPVIGEDDRCGVLEELESIDYLVRFDADTPIDLIEAIRPDVLVKGADYAKEAVVGWDVVEGYGGRVALAPLVEGRSTSGVIRRIIDAYKP